MQWYFLQSGANKKLIWTGYLMKKILFYETDRAYGCFSNFSRHPVDIDGSIWQTSEHFFQSQKFSGQADVDAVRAAATPFAAARIGRERHRSFRPDWNTVRDHIMLQVLQAKFSQYLDLREILCSTHGAELIEHTANDAYWADGGDGNGQNMLGKLLEQVRAELGSAHGSFQAPPWIHSPDIEPSDMYWRMGGGEDQLTRAERFRHGLGAAARQQYDLYFPVPKEWIGCW